MGERLNIQAITADTEDWSCKVQVIDKFKGEGIYNKKRYLNVILQDEEENQVKAIVYGDHSISTYDGLFKLFHTYIVAGATLSSPYLRNERPWHTVDWKLLHGALVDPVPGEMYPDEHPLPLPTRLDITPLQPINESAFDEKAVLDVFAIVANWVPPRYNPKTKKTLQEVLLVDEHKQQILLTLWEDHIIKTEGKQLVETFKQYPTVLARRVAVTDFNVKSIATKFNTTIQIDPPYPRLAQLRAWVVEHIESLSSFTRRSTSDSGTLIFVPFEDEIVSIATIASQKDGHTFSVEARMSLPPTLRRFYSLICAGCGTEMGTFKIRTFPCTKCEEKQTMIPRCKFNVNLEDATGSTTATIMGKFGEYMLSLTPEKIYNRTLAQTLQVQDIRDKFPNKMLTIELKKSRTPRATHSTLYVVSYAEKDTGISVPVRAASPSPSSSPDILESTKRKKDSVDTQTEPTTHEAESSVQRQKLDSLQKTESSMLRQKLDPPTPAKKK